MQTRPAPAPAAAAGMALIPHPQLWVKEVEAPPRPQRSHWLDAVPHDVMYRIVAHIDSGRDLVAFAATCRTTR